MPNLPRLAAATLAAAASLLLARPASAQVIFVGTNPNTYFASSTVNGKAVSTTSLIGDIQTNNAPGIIVLYSSGVFGYIPSNVDFNFEPGLYPIYGTYTHLPNGWLVLTGNNNIGHLPVGGGTSTDTAFIGGVILPLNGQFYGFMTLITTSVSPVNNGGTPGTDVDVDVAKFLMPLTVAH